MKVKGDKMIIMRQGGNNDKFGKIERNKRLAKSLAS